MTDTIFVIALVPFLVVATVTLFRNEFGDLDFMTDSATYDRIGIAEGKVVSLIVDERDAPDDLAVGKVLWIVDGTAATATHSMGDDRQ